MERKSPEGWTPLRTSFDLAVFLEPKLSNENANHLKIVFTDEECKVIDTATMYCDETTVRENIKSIFQMAVRKGAAAIALGRNHTHSNPAAFQNDILMTRRLLHAGQTMDIPLLDFVVLGTPTRFHPEGFSSMLRGGYITTDYPSLTP